MLPYHKVSSLTMGPAWCHTTENSALHNHYQENLMFQYLVVLIPELLIVHTAVVDTIWLTLEQPHCVMHVPKTFTFLGIQCLNMMLGPIITLLIIPLCIL
jgi:hypothetical protein